MDSTEWEATRWYWEADDGFKCPLSIGGLPLEVDGDPHALAILDVMRDIHREERGTEDPDLMINSETEEPEEIQVKEKVITHLLE